MKREAIHRMRQHLAGLSAPARRTLLRRAGPSAVYDWPVRVARDSQLLPEGDWLLWLILAGRGWGKTRTGAETIRAWVDANDASNYALIAPTAAMARDVMVEGEGSGLLSVFPPHQRPVYEPSKCKLTFYTGATAHLHSADEPDRLRGPQHGKAWADEVSTWRRGTDAWRNLLLGLRQGRLPQVVVTATPRPNALTIELLKGAIMQEGKGVVTRGSSHEPDSYSRTILAPYEGTRLGRQEIEGELLEDVPGALWTYDLLDECRVDAAPSNLVRVVFGIDPAVSTSEDSAETGLVVVARGRDEHGYVLADGSGKFTPNQWAERARAMKQTYRADAYVIEANQGGDMCEATLRTVDPVGKIVRVHASRGKVTRAEPVAALYEQRRVHHADPHGDAFRTLEAQMCEFVPGAATSPDRMDALVWALSELFLRDQTYYGEVNMVAWNQVLAQMGYTPARLAALRRGPW